MTTDNASAPRTSAAASWPFVLIFIAAWIGWLGVLGWVRHAHPGLDHGDLTTDANILNAGENFDREGFWKTGGVPAVDTFRAEGKRPDFYITYPPGCYWIHQLYKAAGVRELASLRIAAIAASGLGALLFFVLCMRISGSACAAMVAGLAYMLTRPFAEYADNLHYIAFSQLTLMATLLGWVLLEEATTSAARLRWAVLTGAVFAMDAFVTFEHTLFVGAFAAVRIVLLRRWALAVWLAALCAAPVAVLAARFLVNSIALGSFGEVWSHMAGKFRQRTGLGGAGVGFDEVGRAVLTRLGWPPLRGPGGGPDAEFRIGVLAPAVLLPMVVLAVITLATWHLEHLRAVRRMAGGALALLIGGATWYIVMREHAVGHRFTVLLLLPGIAAAIGTLVAAGWSQWRAQPRGAPVRLAGLVAGCILLVAHIAQLRHAHVLNIPWKLDGAVHAVNLLRVEFDERFAAARPHMKGIERLYMYTHDAQAARKLGVRFDNAIRVVHAPLAENEAQAVIWLSERHRSVAGEAHKLLGPARFMAPPADYLAIHFAGRTELGAMRLAGSQGLELRRAWVEPTLDGSGVVLGAEAASSEKGFKASALMLHARILGPDGSPRERTSVGFEQRVAAEGAGHAWVFFDGRALEGAGSLELWLVDRAAKRRIRFEGSGATLPEGVRLSDDGKSLILTPP